MSFERHSSTIRGHSVLEGENEVWELWSMMSSHAGEQNTAWQPPHLARG
jgi:hypothetical protein